MHTLQVFLTSTRPGRAGEPISLWFLEHARAHGNFEVTLVDLEAVALPMMDEPHHPRLRQYEHEHTKAWSATVNAADAFVFVLPEYNYSMPPAFVNALDFLLHEWAYKPVGIVSYGGVSAGLRSAQQAKQLITALRMMPLPDAVSIPMYQQFMDEQRNFLGNDILNTSIVTMLDELERWTGALAPLRAPVHRR
ncbi:MAG: NAD(P)H-dependent oxidoreductase [Gemmatimonadota bacterium]